MKPPLTADPPGTYVIPISAPAMPWAIAVDDSFLYVSAGVYAASTNGPFQLVARRGTNGVVSLTFQGKALRTPAPVDMGSGVPQLFTVTLKDARGRSVLSQSVDFCPGGFFGQSRVDPSGPDRSAYPYFCGTNLTRAIVWGIDKGWASPVTFGLDGSSLAATRVANTPSPSRTSSTRLISVACIGSA